MLIEGAVEAARPTGAERVSLHGIGRGLAHNGVGAEAQKVEGGEVGDAPRLPVRTLQLHACAVGGLDHALSPLVGAVVLVDGGQQRLRLPLRDEFFLLPLAQTLGRPVPEASAQGWSNVGGSGSARSAPAAEGRAPDDTARSRVYAPFLRIVRALKQHDVKDEYNEGHLEDHVEGRLLIDNAQVAAGEGRGKTRFAHVPPAAAAHST